MPLMGKEVPLPVLPPPPPPPLLLLLLLPLLLLLLLLSPPLEGDGDGEADGVGEAAGVWDDISPFSPRAHVSVSNSHQREPDSPGFGWESATARGPPRTAMVRHP